MSSITDVSSSSRSPQSKSNADRSRPGSSSASRSKSQSLSLLLLSTSRRAFTCSGVRSSTQTHGTSSMPSFFAAIARQWPITITPLRSITIGYTKPYCLMLSATLLICRLSCFFALDAYGIISAIGLLWITISLPFLTHRPPTTGLCHWHVCPRLPPHPNANFCAFAPSGRSRSPAPQGRKEGKKMNRHGQVAPAYPAYLYVYLPRTPQTKNFFIFLLFPLDIPRNAW